MQTESTTIYSPTSLAKRISSISVTAKSENPEYVVNRLSQKYDSYQGLLHRRRLSSTGDGSGDSSTTASGSSYGEREEGSEGRTECEEIEERKPPEGMVTETERQQVETFFRGLKTQVGKKGNYGLVPLFKAISVMILERTTF